VETRHKLGVDNYWYTFQKGYNNFTGGKPQLFTYTISIHFEINL